MILQPNQVLPREDGVRELRTDVCIVGAGAAGISLALELRASGLSVLVLAGGTERETAFAQDLYRGAQMEDRSHEPLEEGRRRAFGGSTIAWGGRCVPLDPIDFTERSWIPHSGWPLSYETLLPFYARASRLCQTGRFDFDATTVFPGSAHEIIRGMDNAQIRSTHLERWSPPVNFATGYRSQLAESTSVTVLLDTHLLRLHTELGGVRVRTIAALCGGESLRIRAATVVLACGAIENARLLLASKDSYHPHGIGNGRDLVGRYYMGHISGILTDVAPIDRDALVFNFERDSDGVDCRRRWWLTPQAQRGLGIGNAILYLHRRRDMDGHRDVVFSAAYVVKFLLGMFRAGPRAVTLWKGSRRELGAHASVIVRDAWFELPRLARLGMARVRKRRLPFVLPSVRSEALGVYFQSEHLPNPDSRVTLSPDEFDAHGMPRARVSVAFGELDRRTALEAHRIFFDAYERAGAGRHEADEQALRQRLECKLSHFNSAAHHLGTTRMSADPRTGVVDADGLVHGMHNLYVAGASVFPTGGHANPTFTIVALAARLADHLASQAQGTARQASRSTGAPERTLGDERLALSRVMQE